MGALLHNPSPGESFKAGDLVRNLMLAAVANETLEEQEAFYKKYWLQPIEEKINDLTKFLKIYVQEIEDFKHESKLEGIAKQCVAKSGPGKYEDLSIYAKFYSYYEWKLMESIQDANVQDVKMVDSESMLKVTIEILKDFANKLLLTL